MTDHIYWKNGSLFVLDQRKLPFREEFVRCTKLTDVVAAIRKMVVRGAPLIGVTAAYGVVIGIARILQKKRHVSLSELELICRTLITTRPTAVNLAWAVKRMENKCRVYLDNPLLLEYATREAMAIHGEDVENNQLLSRYGAELIDSGDTILTHCNAGALATGGYGTALGVIKAAHDAGKRIKVFATETRPYFQGARLTVFELKNLGIDVELIPDNHVGILCYYKVIDKVIVGADRIVGNGDTANKIGTYMIALAAREYKIPFYVAAPVSTFDWSLNNGNKIDIEERDGKEVKYFRKTLVTLQDVKARYYSFDVTPSKYISAFITEKGIVNRPFKKQIAMLFSP
ncbi:MAG: S-methyl-5-thioribose-1-phosphate isomerase [Syntrophobacterales bacterium]|nr:S-methyl-5-thioribose-1-phosphate isomerase [Syntrophobacterales bacterium]